MLEAAHVNARHFAVHIEVDAGDIGSASHNLGQPAGHDVRISELHLRNTDSPIGRKSSQRADEIGNSLNGHGLRSCVSACNLACTIHYVNLGRHATNALLRLQARHAHVSHAELDHSLRILAGQLGNLHSQLKTAHRTSNELQLLRQLGGFLLPRSELDQLRASSHRRSGRPGRSGSGSASRSANNHKRTGLVNAALFAPGVVLPSLDAIVSRLAQDDFVAKARGVLERAAFGVGHFVVVATLPITAEIQAHTLPSAIVLTSKTGLEVTDDVREFMRHGVAEHVIPVRHHHVGVEAHEVVVVDDLHPAVGIGDALPVTAAGPTGITPTKIETDLNVRKRNAVVAVGL